MSNYTMNDHSFQTTIPKELVVNIELPRSKGVTGLELDITSTSLQLLDEEQKYKLELKLPYKIYPDNAKAKFDKKSKSLMITMITEKPALPVVKFETKEVSPIEVIQENNETNVDEDDSVPQAIEEKEMVIRDDTIKDEEQLPQFNLSAENQCKLPMDLVQSSVTNFKSFSNKYLTEID
jgi:hypothetical protein